MNNTSCCGSWTVLALLTTALATLAACGGGDGGAAGSDAIADEQIAMETGLAKSVALAEGGTEALAATGATYYVDPTGSDTATGSKEAPWKTIARAQTAARAGDTVYFRGGTYSYTKGVNNCASQTDTVNVITLNKSGASGSVIRYWAYPGERPVFDFSPMKSDCRVKGFNVTGSYIHLRDLEITGAPQNNTRNNESWGVWISGNRNTFERLNLHHHMGPGLFIENGSYNLVLNTDSHHNHDLRSKSGSGQNADGFGAHIAANNPGNVFRGCRAWANTDDGFDLINAYSSVTIENSWAWLHGYLPGSTTPIAAGNGNGFKVGGYGGGYVSNGVKHVVRFSVAFNNKAAGFYANHHTVANDYVSNTGYNNGVNFNMLSVNSRGAATQLGNLRNNLAYKGVLTSNIANASQVRNSWNLSVSISDADFQSVSTGGWEAARQSDGSLPVMSKLRLAAGSDLIDKGGDVGYAFTGLAPDLGAFER